MTMTLDDKVVDVNTLEIDGIDRRDYPDFCDAYFSAGKFVDGTPLTTDELYILSCDNREALYERVIQTVY